MECWAEDESEYNVSNIVKLYTKINNHTHHINERSCKYYVCIYDNCVRWSFRSPPIKEYLKKQFLYFFFVLLMFATNWLFLFLSVYCLRETLINFIVLNLQIKFITDDFCCSFALLLFTSNDSMILKQLKSMKFEM